MVSFAGQRLFNMQTKVLTHAWLTDDVHMINLREDNMCNINYIIMYNKQIIRHLFDHLWFSK
mgnify:CR=1 FL=1